MRQEKGTVWTLCPRDAEDVWGHTKAHTAGGMVPTSWFGAVPWVFVSKEKGARSRSAAEPGCEMGCEKQEVKGSLSSRGFGRGQCSCPDPAADAAADAHTDTFTLAAVRRLPGPLLPLARKEGIPLTHRFFSPSLETFPEMTP